MTRIVDEFLCLPAETQQTISLKDREHVSELLVNVLVESHFKLRSEDLEMAMSFAGEKLHPNEEFQAATTQLQELMKKIKEPAFIESPEAKAAKQAKEAEQAKAAEQAAKQAPTREPAMPQPKGNSGPTPKGKKKIPGTGSHACNIAVISASVFAVTLFAFRGKLSSK